MRNLSRFLIVMNGSQDEVAETIAFDFFVTYLMKFPAKTNNNVLPSQLKVALKAVK